jgi:putative transposase
MNNRDYKNFVSGGYYHIYNRGNGKMDIFRDDQDYYSFLKRLRLVLGMDDKLPTNLRIIPFKKKSFLVVCYCLMANHFHILIKQNTLIPISNLVSKICTSYSKYFNKKYDRVGHLFQDQFKAVNVNDDRYLLWLSAYIHLNPKLAGLCDPAEYKWSSYREYIDDIEGGLCDSSIILERFKNRDEYVQFVEDGFQKIKNGNIIERDNIISE